MTQECEKCRGEGVLVRGDDERETCECSWPPDEPAGCVSCALDDVCPEHESGIAPVFQSGHVSLGEFE